MKIENSNKCDNPLDDCTKWVLETFPKVKGKPLSIEVNSEGKINFIESSVPTDKDKIKIQKKYSELKT